MKKMVCKGRWQVSDSLGCVKLPLIVSSLHDCQFPNIKNLFLDFQRPTVGSFSSWTIYDDGETQHSLRKRKFRKDCVVLL